MPSLSLCVRVVFRRKRPSDDYLKDLGGLGPGSWLRWGGRLTRCCPTESAWESMWLCTDVATQDFDNDRDLLCQAESIEQAWERENAPKVETAEPGPQRCPACDHGRGERTRMDILSDPDSKFGRVAYRAFYCDACGYMAQHQFHYPKPST